MLLIDRAETTRDGKGGFCTIAAENRGLARLLHQRTIRVACSSIRNGRQHGAIKRTQIKMRDKCAQLHKDVETCWIQIPPEARLDCNGLLQRCRRRSSHARNLDVIQPTFEAQSHRSVVDHVSVISERSTS